LPSSISNFCCSVVPSKFEILVHAIRTSTGSICQWNKLVRVVKFFHVYLIYSIIGVAISLILRMKLRTLHTIESSYVEFSPRAKIGLLTKSTRTQNDKVRFLHFPRSKKPLPTTHLLPVWGLATRREFVQICTEVPNKNWCHSLLGIIPAHYDQPTIQLPPNGLIYSKAYHYNPLQGGVLNA
jgi:hypothetical protein